MEVIIMNFKLFTKYSNIEMLLLTNFNFFFCKRREYQNMEQTQVFYSQKYKNLKTMFKAVSS